MKPAFIIIDMLEDFFVEGRLKERRHELVKNINELTEVARKQGVPVIWVRQEFKADLSDAPQYMRTHDVHITIENTQGSQLLEGLRVAETDHVVVKKRYSAFFKTTLDELLKNIGVDTLIFGGINTHACVRTSVIDAYQRDYQVIIATDCTDSYDKPHHDISIDYLKRTISSLKTNQEIRGLIEAEV